jgi:hypothetical protein
MAKSAVVVVCLAGWLTAACAKHGTEQLLLEQFFSASRLRDRTALQQVSTVVFEPLQQGTVSSFTITAVTVLEPPVGGVAAEQITVQAPVRLPDGQTATRRIVLLLQRRDRWIVTGYTMVG